MLIYLITIVVPVSITTYYNYMLYKRLEVLYQSMNRNIKRLDYSMSCINKKINFCIEYPYIQPVEVIDSKSNVLMSDAYNNISDIENGDEQPVDKIYLVL